MAEPDDILLDAFARALRQQRLAKGLSQEELAHRAGVSMRYISLLESRHHQPSLSTIRGICSGLEISMVKLFNIIEQDLL